MEVIDQWSDFGLSLGLKIISFKVIIKKLSLNAAIIKSMLNA
ncbi:hypothetical protein COTS27_01536 [Spirochaetota bacterium]|nr:hypothetical protein COTS27_01536 [Spirochaetota bacterium]